MILVGIVQCYQKKLLHGPHCQLHFQHVELFRLYLKKNSSNFGSINIGTGYGKSVLEVIKTFQLINDVQFDYEFVERRLGDQPFVVADNKLALKLLSWSPTRNISDMCTDYILTK